MLLFTDGVPWAEAAFQCQRCRFWVRQESLSFKQRLSRYSTLLSTTVQLYLVYLSASYRKLSINQLHTYSADDTTGHLRVASPLPVIFLSSFCVNDSWSHSLMELHVRRYFSAVGDSNFAKVLFRISTIYLRIFYTALYPLSATCVLFNILLNIYSHV